MRWPPTPSRGVSWGPGGAQEAHRPGGAPPSLAHGGQHGLPKLAAGKFSQRIASGGGPSSARMSAAKGAYKINSAPTDSPDSSAASPTGPLLNVGGWEHPLARGSYRMISFRLGIQLLAAARPCAWKACINRLAAAAAASCGRSIVWLFRGTSSGKLGPREKTKGQEKGRARTPAARRKVAPQTAAGCRCPPPPTATVGSGGAPVCARRGRAALIKGADRSIMTPFLPPQSFLPPLNKLFPLHFSHLGHSCAIRSVQLPASARAARSHALRPLVARRQRPRRHARKARQC